MAQSIGDLVINLGFNVDKQKLDDFNDSVNDTFQGILKFAGLDLSVQGLAKIGTTAAQSALWMRDLNASFGTSYDWMQKFQGQWAFFHPGDDPNSVAGVERHVAEYQARMRRGEGGGEAGRFGIFPSDSLDQMFEKVRTQIPLMIKSGMTLGQISELATKIFGDPNIMVMLQASDKELENAGQLLQLTEQQKSETVEAAQALGSLHLAWDNFTNHIVASLASFFNKGAEEISQKGWGTVIREGIKNLPANEMKLGPAIVKKEHEFGMGIYGVARGILWGTKDDPYGLYQDYKKPLNQESGGGGGRKQQAISYFMSQGHSQAQAEGMVAGLMKEDGSLDPGATNPTSGAYGIAQWLTKSRVAGFQEHEGVPLKGSSFEQQLDYIEWELRHQENKAGKLLDQAQTKEQAQNSWKNDYERSVPITNHNTINVYGPGDPHEAARAVVQGIVEVTVAQYQGPH